MEAAHLHHPAVAAVQWVVAAASEGRQHLGRTCLEGELRGVERSRMQEEGHTGREGGRRGRGEGLLGREGELLGRGEDHRGMEGGGHMASEGAWNQEEACSGGSPGVAWSLEKESECTCIYVCLCVCVCLCARV